MARNVEIKAVARDVAELRERALALSGTPPTLLRQIDTFFHTPAGRLKLRELAPDCGELIWYERADEAGPRRSTYFRAPTSDPAALLHVLAGAYGVLGVVEKTRELSLVGRTRIHVDDVAGLGSFVELEFVMGEGDDDAAGARAVEELMAALGIRDGDLVTRAYIDLLLDANGPPCARPS
jgi:adenylate cyclase class IV